MAFYFLSNKNKDKNRHTLHKFNVFDVQETKKNREEKFIFSKFVLYNEIPIKSLEQKNLTRKLFRMKISSHDLLAE